MAALIVIRVNKYIYERHGSKRRTLIADQSHRARPLYSRLFPYRWARDRERVFGDAVGANGQVDVLYVI